jgi:DNA-binding CsgD family transcriptional regulator
MKKRRPNSSGALNGTELSYFFAACRETHQSKTSQEHCIGFWLRHRGKQISIAIPGISDGLPSVELVPQARSAGAGGYLLKSNTSRVKEAIRSLRAGRGYTDPDLPKIPRRNPIEEPTDRKKDILRHMAQLKPRKQIARDLNIEPVTVNCHCKNIKARLNINSAQELLKTAIEYYGENR